MADTIFVIPAPGLRIPDPATGRDLPETGGPVTPSRYWRQRLKDGDVTAADTAPAIEAGRKKKEV